MKQATKTVPVCIDESGRFRILLFYMMNLSLYPGREVDISASGSRIQVMPAGEGRRQRGRTVLVEESGCIRLPRMFLSLLHSGSRAYLSRYG